VIERHCAVSSEKEGDGGDYGDARGEHQDATWG
jgi:hypothetical protein